MSMSFLLWIAFVFLTFLNLNVITLSRTFFSSYFWQHKTLFDQVTVFLPVDDISALLQEFD